MENKKSPPKLINEYSVEELLELMGSSKEDVSQKSEEEYVSNQSIRFLAYYDIKPGNHRISTKMLFKLFKSWTKDKSYKYEDFVKDLYNQLEMKTTTFQRNKHQYFKINKNILNITRYLEESKPKKIIFRKTMFYKKFMEEFLEQHNIKAGPIFVEADILYYLFDYYNQKKTRRMVSYEKFVSLCHLYFDTKQLGLGSTWFGVNESIKSLITEEWVKTWRQGRVKYGYIIKEKSKETKSKFRIHTYNEERQKQKVLYSETLPEEESEK